MITDRELITALRKEISPRTRMSDERREAIERQIEAYVIACLLSRGPVPNRSAHWEAKARRRQLGLHDTYHGLTGHEYMQQPGRM